VSTDISRNRTAKIESSLTRLGRPGSHAAEVYASDLQEAKPTRCIRASASETSKPNAPPRGGTRKQKYYRRIYCRSRARLIIMITARSRIGRGPVALYSGLRRRPTRGNMDWYVLHRRGTDLSIARAPTEDAAMQAAINLYRCGATIEEIGVLAPRRRRVVLRDMQAMDRVQELFSSSFGV
jgi:hypothetical protein